MRLQKYLSNCGLASRRKCEELISMGKIQVNGVTVQEPGFIVEEGAHVAVDGERVELEKLQYVMVNKPVGYLTAVSEDPDRFTVMNLVRDIKTRIYPVGRLDVASEGLLIMTNDGNLAQKLTHPAHHIEKVYDVVVAGNLSREIINSIKSGTVIDGYKTKPISIEVIGISGLGVRIKMKLLEGRNRQIRKMFDKFGCVVKSIKRIFIGEIALGNLPRGKWRWLSQEEIEKLNQA